MWAEDNVKRPYLLADVIRDKEGNIVQSGPVAYTKAATIPQPTAALLEIATAALGATLLGGQRPASSCSPT